MKVSELISTLEQHDPSSDVVISGVPSGYLDFKTEIQDGTSLEHGGLPVIALKATKEIPMIFVTIEE
jgi:hypothetical protein